MKPRYQEFDVNEPATEGWKLMVTVLQDDLDARNFEFLDSVSIQEACETVAVHVVAERMLNGEGIAKTSCIVTWKDGRLFGPFQIKFALSATVQNLRQGD